jgi:hypothetical protein
VEHPINTDVPDADEWLLDLASRPLTTVTNPGRSSTLSLSSYEAVTNGEREVSPRELVDRILALRTAMTREFIEDMEDCAADAGASVRRRLLERTVGKL